MKESTLPNYDDYICKSPRYLTTIRGNKAVALKASTTELFKKRLSANLTELLGVHGFHTLTRPSTQAHFARLKKKCLPPSAREYNISSSAYRGTLFMIWNGDAPGFWEILWSRYSRKGFFVLFFKVQDFKKPDFKCKIGSSYTKFRKSSYILGFWFS